MSGALGAVAGSGGVKTAVDTQTVTVGFVPEQPEIENEYGQTIQFYRAAYYGYYQVAGSGINHGSISDDSSNIYGGADIRGLTWTDGTLVFEVAGSRPNSGWNSLMINGITYTRASANYQTNATRTVWYMPSAINPFGSTVGATRVVTFYE